MNKKEYKDTFKTTRPEDLKTSLHKLKSMNKKQAEEYIQSINNKYLELMLKDLNFWISMHDYVNHIKHLNLNEKKKAKFISNNKEFLEFHKLLKARIDFLEVISIDDMLEATKNEPRKI